MSNTLTHHLSQNIFHKQSHPLVVQQSSTSGPVKADTRTQSHHPAGRPRQSPLDAGNGISRASARHPADRKAGRPGTAPTQNQLVKEGRGILPQVGEGVLLTRPHSNTDVSHSTTRRSPTAGSNPHTTQALLEGKVPIDPDSPHSPQKLSKRPLLGVRQDKAHLESVPSGTPQPSPVTKVTLSLFTNNDVVRSQTVFGAKQKSSRVSFWADPSLKERLTHKAHKEGLSVSATCAAFLRKSLQEDIDLEYSATLDPIIDRSIARNMRSLATRLTWLLVRIAFDAGQTRSLVTNILGRQKGVNDPVLKTILDSSSRSAKANIMRRTPQISQLISSVEQWMTEDNRGEKDKKTHD